MEKFTFEGKTSPLALGAPSFCLYVLSVRLIYSQKVAEVCLGSEDHAHRCWLMPQPFTSKKLIVKELNFSTAHAPEQESGSDSNEKISLRLGNDRENGDALAGS